MPRPHTPTSLPGCASLSLRDTNPALVDLTRAPGRVELSGRVLTNWWAKNTGLLRDELGLAEGSTVLLRAAASWRTVPLVLAALGLGATVIEAPPDAAGSSPAGTAPHAVRAAEVDLVIADSLADEDTLTASELLAVATEPLAFEFPEPLPAWATDHAAQVRAQPDAFELDPGAAGEARWAVSGSEGSLAQLEERAAAEAAAGAAGAVSSLSSDAGVLAAVAQLLAAGEGSVVLHAGPAPEERVVQQERITRAGGLTLR